MQNDPLRIQDSKRGYEQGDYGYSWARGLASSSHSTQDNDICPSYCDGYVDYTHEL